MVTSFNEELRANAEIHTGRRTAAQKKDAIHFQKIGHPYEGGIQAQPFQSGELQKVAVEFPSALNLYIGRNGVISALFQRLRLR